MGYGTSIDIVQGYKVPYGKLIKENKSVHFLCDHDFDRQESNYCPKCGSEGKSYEKIDCESLIDINIDDLEDPELELSENIVLKHVYGDHEEEDNDYVIGILIHEEDPDCPNPQLVKLGTYTEKHIKEEIEKCDIKIPYDPESFGIYIIYSIS
jgi:hypothetical protein